MSRTAIRNVILILVLLVILVGLFLWLRPSSTQQDSSTASESFDATITGRFAIEDHDTGTELGTLLVQPR